MAGETERNILEIGLALVASTFLAVFGFFWKMSHRVTAAEKEVEHLKQATSRDYKQLRRDVDYILNKVDTADDRLHSIVKNLPKRD